MSQQRHERNLSDCRTLTEALARALHDSGKTVATVAEVCGVRRSYLADALNTERADVLQFQARHLVAFCRATHSALPLAWLADQLGYVLVPREQATAARDIAIETLDVVSHVGDLSKLVRDAYEDGQLTEQERSDIRDRARRIQKEAAEVERATTLSPISLTPTRRPA
jgi:hypothetical protein